MALKRHFTEEEKYGLTQEEIRLGEKYLRKNKTAGKIAENEALKLYELYLIGHSFNELAAQFPQYTVDRIIMTAALTGWAKDRDNMQYSLRDRVQAKVVKSVIEQVDFLTTLMSVSNAEHLDAMKKYIMDPVNNPKPDLRIETIKEYKEVAETLYKLVAGSTPGSQSKTSPMFNALAPAVDKREATQTKQEDSVADFIASQVKENE
jgi:hypothetical protein